MGVEAGKTEPGTSRLACDGSFNTPRVQVPNNHILSKILTYITTILNPSTGSFGPLGISSVGFPCKGSGLGFRTIGFPGYPKWGSPGLKKVTSRQTTVSQAKRFYQGCKTLALGFRVFGKGPYWLE